MLVDLCFFKTEPASVIIVMSSTIQKLTFLTLPINASGFLILLPFSQCSYGSRDIISSATVTGRVIAGRRINYRPCMRRGKKYIVDTPAPAPAPAYIPVLAALTPFAVVVVFLFDP